MGYKRVFEKSYAALQGMSVVSVKLESARQLLCHGRERRSVGTARPTFTCSTARWPAAHNRYSRRDQRDFYLLRTGCQWRLLPREFPAWGTVVPPFPHVEELRCVDLPATRNL